MWIVHSVAARQYEIRAGPLCASRLGHAARALADPNIGDVVSSKIIVAEVTTTVRGIPQEISLGRRERLLRASVANLDNVHVIPISAIGELVGTLAAQRQREIKRALGYALDWPELKVL